MRRSVLIIAESTFLIMATTTIAVAQSAPTAPASGDTSVQPFGLPITTWFAILLGSGGGAVIGKEFLSAVKSGVSVIKTYSEDYPARLKRDSEREGAETLEIQENARFSAIINKALEQREATINSLQAGALEQNRINSTLLGNATQQAILITQVQQAMIDQQTAHTKELEAINGRVNEMSAQLQLKDGQLEVASRLAAEYKEKYEAEQRAREKAETEREEYRQKWQAAEERLKQYESGEFAVVKLPDSNPADISSTTLTPGVPAN